MVEHFLGKEGVTSSILVVGYVLTALDLKEEEKLWQNRNLSEPSRM